MTSLVIQASVLLSSECLCELILVVAFPVSDSMACSFLCGAVTLPSSYLSESVSELLKNGRLPVSLPIMPLLTDQRFNVILSASSMSVSLSEDVSRTTVVIGREPDASGGGMKVFVLSEFPPFLDVGVAVLPSRWPVWGNTELSVDVSVDAGFLFGC